MQDDETTAVSVAAALKASKVVNCSFHMLRTAAVGGFEAVTRLLGCLLTRQSQLRPLHLRRPGLPDSRGLLIRVGIPAGLVKALSDGPLQTFEMEHGVAYPCS